MAGTGTRNKDRAGDAPAGDRVGPVLGAEALLGGGVGRAFVGGAADEDRPGAAVSAALGRRRLIIVIAVLLYLFGLVMVTSATSGTSALGGGDQWVYLRKQLLFGVLAFLGMGVTMRMPLGFLRRMSWPLVIVATGGLMLVFLPGLGHTANGATRWINLGPMQFQPSELVKLAVLVYVADHLARTNPPEHWWRDFWRSPGGAGLLLAGMIFVQRDMGTAMVTSGVVITLYMLAGTRWRLLVNTVGPLVALAAIGIISEPFRRERFLAFLNPWADPLGPGYQLVQALIAIGSGGPFGVGLGHSVQKIHYLPESHTDMIFSIVGEELGLVGAGFVVFAFAALAVVGARTALKAPDRFQSLLAAGLTTMLCGQAALNVAGVTGVLPLTGVPLPLVSYGGSNLLISLAALGLLANVALPPRNERALTGSARSDGDDVADDAPRARRRGGNGGAPGARPRGRRQPA